MSVGEQPLSFWTGKNRIHGGRRELWGKLREFFDMALQYALEPSPGFDRSLAAMMPVMRGEMMLRVQANTAADMHSATEFFAAYPDLRYCFVHATESYLMAEELKRAQIPVVLGPFFDYPYRAEQLNAHFDCGAIPAKAGIRPLCFIGADWEMESVRTHTGRMMAYGLTEDKALEGLTAAPAKLMNIDRRMGYIRAGYDGDPALFNGAPLSNLTRCVGTVIDGELYREGWA